MMYALVTMTALFTVLADRRELARSKRLTAAYASLYALALGIVFISIANRDTPGPVQLIKFLLHPLAELLFQTS